MEKLRLNEEEFEKVIDISKYINLPDEPPMNQMVVGCKGCEGGCAAAICAR